MAESFEKAVWIWARQAHYRAYNRTIQARRRFTTGVVQAATLKITADTRYRLFVNGEWVNDGPCRSWPEHYQYDVLDLTSYLQPGQNELRVIATYFGIGTFHQRPLQAGLLAELTLLGADGRTDRLVTDETWETASCPQWLPATPKISIQHGPFEVVDARLDAADEDKEEAWHAAACLHDAHTGPWQDLQPRDVALLSRVAFPCRRFVEANRVAPDSACQFSTNAARLLHPDIVEANHGTSHTFALAAVLQVPEARELELQGEEVQLYLDGQALEETPQTVTAGDHLLVATGRGPTSHDRTQVVRIVPGDAVSLRHLLPGDHPTPWALLPMPELAARCQPDVPVQSPAAAETSQAAYEAWCAGLPGTIEAFTEAWGDALQDLPVELDLIDPEPSFRQRQVVGSATELVRAPMALLHDTAAYTTIEPAADGDLELVYDLGEQNCGYWQFDLIAEAGLIVDIFAVEYVTAEGKLQHPGRTRNGLRYICRAGANRFTSLKRRSGRYLYVTLRRQTQPVRIRHLQLIESTYPVDGQGAFACSDERLTRIWEISARTLKLCMEDVFVDCPLYEQTLWIGDARNEALFAYTAFGATDLAARCIRLGGQSLERYPLVGCQVPTSWDAVLSAWSFLWGIGVWDYWFYTRDRALLEEAWPWVTRNLRGAEQYLDEDGLFSGPFWNMFDWSGADQHHQTVLHNSMLLVGAIRAAEQCAEVLADTEAHAWLAEWRQRLCAAINATWDDQRQSYPDSIHDDGTVSESTCQHTSALALLYDIVPEAHRQAALRNLLDPPAGMVQVGSPFAIQYIYEAMEKTGRPEAILDSIYENYLPMLAAGATTVWETFPRSVDKPEEFPTRSHVHAWSSAPVHFLNRLLLGIRQVEAGGQAYVISPHLQEDLSWARGRTMTLHGPIAVAWQRTGKQLTINVQAPPGVDWTYQANHTHNGLDVEARETDHVPI